jgi:hypothetical protein
METEINLNPDLASAKTIQRLCGCCGKVTTHTAEISVILVKLSAMEDPYPLIPSVAYRLCMDAKCKSLLNFVERAVDAHPSTRFGGVWLKATVLFKDFSGAGITPDIPKNTIGLA